MSKQEMLKKIYEVIADKTLSFGCKVLHKADMGVCYDVKYMYTWGKYDNRPYNVDEIIWHPVMIGDVLNYIDGITPRTNISQNILDIVFIWWKKNEPIDDQSEECITFIYNLIKDATK